MIQKINSLDDVIAVLTNNSAETLIEEEIGFIQSILNVLESDSSNLTKVFDKVGLEALASFWRVLEYNSIPLSRLTPLFNKLQLTQKQDLVIQFAKQKWSIFDRGSEIVSQLPVELRALFFQNKTYENVYEFRDTLKQFRNLGVDPHKYPNNIGDLEAYQEELYQQLYSAAKTQILKRINSIDTLFHAILNLTHEDSFDVLQRFSHRFPEWLKSTKDLSLLTQCISMTSTDGHDEAIVTLDLAETLIEQIKKSPLPQDADEPPMSPAQQIRSVISMLPIEQRNSFCTKHMEDLLNALQPGELNTIKSSFELWGMQLNELDSYKQFLQEVAIKKDADFLEPDIITICRELNEYSIDLDDDEKPFKEKVDACLKKSLPKAIVDYDSFVTLAGYKSYINFKTSCPPDFYERTKTFFNTQEKLITLFDTISFDNFKPFLVDFIQNCKKENDFSPFMDFILNLIHYNISPAEDKNVLSTFLRDNINQFDKDIWQGFAIGATQQVVPARKTTLVEFFNSVLPSQPNTIEQYIASRSYDQRTYFTLGASFFGGVDKDTKLTAAKALQHYIESVSDNPEATLIVTKNELAALQQGRLKQIAAPFLVKAKIEVVESREQEQKLDNDDESSALIDKKMN